MCADKTKGPQSRKQAANYPSNSSIPNTNQPIIPSHLPPANRLAPALELPPPPAAPCCAFGCMPFRMLSLTSAARGSDTRSPRLERQGCDTCGAACGGGIREESAAVEEPGIVCHVTCTRRSTSISGLRYVRNTILSGKPDTSCWTVGAHG